MVKVKNHTAVAVRTGASGTGKIGRVLQCGIVSQRCIGIKDNGKRCYNKVLTGGPYCIHHRTPPNLKGKAQIETFATEKKLYSGDKTENDDFKRRLRIVAPLEQRDTVNWKDKVLVKKNEIVLDLGENNHKISLESFKKRGGTDNPLQYQNHVNDYRNQACEHLGLLALIPRVNEAAATCYRISHYIRALEDLKHGDLITLEGEKEILRKNRPSVYVKIWNGSAITNRKDWETAGGVKKSNVKKRDAPRQYPSRLSKDARAEVNRREKEAREKREAKERRLAAQAEARKKNKIKKKPRVVEAEDYDSEGTQENVAGIRQMMGSRSR
jgi:hypothetical protein